MKECKSLNVLEEPIYFAPGPTGPYCEKCFYSYICHCVYVCVCLCTYAHVHLQYLNSTSQDAGFYQGEKIIVSIVKIALRPQMTNRFLNRRVTHQAEMIKQSLSHQGCYQGFSIVPYLGIVYFELTLIIINFVGFNYDYYAAFNEVVVFHIFYNPACECCYLI